MNLICSFSRFKLHVMVRFTHLHGIICVYYRFLHSVVRFLLHSVSFELTYSVIVARSTRRFFVDGSLEARLAYCVRVHARHVGFREVILSGDNVMFQTIHPGGCQDELELSFWGPQSGGLLQLASEHGARRAGASAQTDGIMKRSSSGCLSMGYEARRVKSSDSLCWEKQSTTFW